MNHIYQNDGYHSEDITTHRNYEEQQENTSFSRNIYKDGSPISRFYEGSGSTTSQLNQQTLYSGETTGSIYLKQLLDQTRYDPR